MESLRKRGKAKLRFRIMNPRVRSSDFKYFKGIFLECLRENEDMARALNECYSRIQVYFFYEISDSGIELAVNTALKDTAFTLTNRPIPATTRSKNRRGCIVMFLGHLFDRSQKRKDIVEIRKYHKNGIFEELCHLVEQNGDVGTLPSSYDELWELSLKSQPRKYWDAITEVIHKLVADRNHYEVYRMMMDKYPQDWIDRFYLYFTNDSNLPKHKENYERWKKDTNERVAMARLITQYLGNLSTLLASSHLNKERISEEQIERLNFMNTMGNDIVESKLKIIEDDNPKAKDVLLSLGESIFHSRDSYFPFVLELWKSVGIFLE